MHAMISTPPSQLGLRNPNSTVRSHPSVVCHIPPSIPPRKKNPRLHQRWLGGDVKNSNHLTKRYPTTTNHSRTVDDNVLPPPFPYEANAARSASFRVILRESWDADGWRGVKE